MMLFLPRIYTCDEYLSRRADLLERLFESTRRAAEAYQNFARDATEAYECSLLELDEEFFGEGA